MNKITTKKKTPPGMDPIYMSAKEGPFRCDNCEYYVDPKSCRKPEMERIQKHSPATVDAGGCCNYYEKK